MFVLYTNNKVSCFGQKKENNIDISNIKKLGEIKKDVCKF